MKIQLDANSVADIDISGAPWKEVYEAFVVWYEEYGKTCEKREGMEAAYFRGIIEAFEQCGGVRRV
jgi:hypothetical protein